MGCDIHMYCEELNCNGEWINKDHFKFCEYSEEREYRRVELCGRRNYSMFTALCGVRDYSGESPKISEPKGVPEDSCSYIQEECEEMGVDGHSHSSATLGEVKEFIDNGNYPIFSGLLSPQQAKELDQGIFPSEWCQGTSASDYVHRTWTNTSIDNPLTDLYEAMKARYVEGNYKDLDELDLDHFRIVFWFDN